MTMRRPFMTALAGLLVLGAALPARAQDAPPPPPGDDEFDEFFGPAQPPRETPTNVRDLLERFREHRRRLRESLDELRAIQEEVKNMPADEERAFFRGAFSDAIDEVVAARQAQGATPEQLEELRWDLEELRDDLAELPVNRRGGGLVRFALRKVGERVMEAAQQVLEKVLEQLMKLNLPGLPGGGGEIIPPASDDWGDEWMDKGLPAPDAPNAAPEAPTPAPAPATPPAGE